MDVPLTTQHRTAVEGFLDAIMMTIRQAEVVPQMTIRQAEVIPLVYEDRLALLPCRPAAAAATATATYSVLLPVIVWRRGNVLKYQAAITCSVLHELHKCSTVQVDIHSHAHTHTHTHTHPLGHTLKRAHRQTNSPACSPPPRMPKLVLIESPTMKARGDLALALGSTQSAGRRYLHSRIPLLRP